MKPRNKFQKQVAELAIQLPTITDKQEQWAYTHLFEHIAKRNTKGEHTCLECGHQWTDTRHKGKTTICPHCGTKLTIHTERQRVFKDIAYYCVLTTFKGYQVIRYFYMEVYRKQGQPIRRFCSEVVERWIAPDGKSAVLARLRPMSCWYDTWQFGSDLEIRPDKPLYDILPHGIYPRYGVMKDIRRNGFKGAFHDLTPFELFHSILTDNKAETLLKSGQFSLLCHFIRDRYAKIDKYWASIRICLRNGYQVEDGNLWCDMVDTLATLNKDIRSPKYICPTDLRAAHDHYQAKRRARQERENIIKKRKEAMEAEQAYKQLKAKFFGIEFTDGIIRIHVLESVQEHLEEGTAMHHCVYDAHYYSKPQSLIFSATKDGERIETIEVSLETMKVVQSRGVCNKNTEYHEQILALMQKNMRMIAQRATA